MDEGFSMKGLRFCRIVTITPLQDVQRLPHDLVEQMRRLAAHWQWWNISKTRSYEFTQTGLHTDSMVGPVEI